MCFDESSNERGRRLYTAESCACPSALHRFDRFCCMHCYHILAASWMHFFILPVHTRCARAFARSTKTSNAKKYYLWFWKVYAPSKRNCYNKTKLWVRLCAWRMRYGCDHRMYVDWSFVPIEYAEMRIYTFAKFTRTQHTHTHTFAPIYNDWANATFMGLAINRDSQAKCILWNLALIYWYHSRSKNEHWATSERHRKKKTKTHSKDEVQFTIFPPSRPCAMCRLCLLGVRAVIYLSIIGVKNRQHGKIIKKNVSVDSQRQRIMHIIYIHANCSICFICIGHERHRPDKSTLVRCV